MLPNFVQTTNAYTLFTNECYFLKQKIKCVIVYRMKFFNLFGNGDISCMEQNA